MTNATHNRFPDQTSLGKFGDLVFARQTPMLKAETHPGLFSSLASRFNAWRDRRVAAAELYSLSDRELADIGVNREQIQAVVNKRFERS